MIIGLSGYARSGKDTIGLYLSEEYDYCRRAFADPLREAALAINPYISNDGLRLADIVNGYGWEAAKAYPETREFLQRLGTDFGREFLGEYVWADLGVKGLTPESNFVFTDCRFPSEAERIKDLGGVMWRVTRKGYGPANNHHSEVALDDWTFDAEIYNFGTKVDLRNSVRLAMDVLHRNAAPVSA